MGRSTLQNYFLTSLELQEQGETNRNWAGGNKQKLYTECTTKATLPGGRSLQNVLSITFTVELRHNHVGGGVGDGFHLEPSAFGSKRPPPAKTP